MTNGPLESAAKANGEKADVGFLGFLRVLALVAVVVGAAGSIGFMLHVGHRNPSRLLIGLFVIWVLSPFVALGLADRVSRRWSVRARVTLHAVMLIVTLGSLAVYGRVALGPPRPQPAFWFMFVPLVSWMLMAIAVAASVSGKSLRGRAGP